MYTLLLSAVGDATFCTGGGGGGDDGDGGVGPTSQACSGKQNANTPRGVGVRHIPAFDRQLFQKLLLLVSPSPRLVHRHSFRPLIHAPASRIRALRLCLNVRDVQLT